MSRSHKFQLERQEPDTYQGGLLRRAEAAVFPALNGMALYSARLEPGAVRVPHWHPNCGEMDYVVSGKARFSIIGNEGETEVIELEPGDICYIPPAYFHYFENIGEGELHVLVWFNNENPEDIGLSEAVSGIPNAALAASLKTSLESVATLSHSHDMIVLGSAK